MMKRVGCSDVDGELTAGLRSGREGSEDIDPDMKVNEYDDEEPAGLITRLDSKGEEVTVENILWEICTEPDSTLELTADKHYPKVEVKRITAYDNWDDPQTVQKFLG